MLCGIFYHPTFTGAKIEVAVLKTKTNILQLGIPEDVWPYVRYAHYDVGLRYC